VITVFVLPTHALSYSAKLLDGTRGAEPYDSVENIDMQLDAGLKLEGLANFFGNDDLVFG
jgi:hypothetical protein